MIFHLLRRLYKRLTRKQDEITVTVFECIEESPVALWSIPLREAVEAKLGRYVSVGAFYVSIQHLEECGLITYFERDILTRIGRRKVRYYELAKEV